MLGDVCFRQAEEFVCYVGIVGVLHRIDKRIEKSIDGILQKTRCVHVDLANGLVEGREVYDAGMCG